MGVCYLRFKTYLKEMSRKSFFFFWWCLDNSVCVYTPQKKGGGIEVENKRDDKEVKGMGIVKIKMDDIKVKGKWMT